MLSHRMGLPFPHDETRNQFLHHKGTFPFVNMNVLYFFCHVLHFFMVLSLNLLEKKNMLFSSLVVSVLLHSN